MFIQYNAPNAMYWMGEDTTKIDLTIPDIDLVNTETWKREKLTNEEWLERFNFRVISYECDPLIENIFK